MTTNFQDPSSFDPQPYLDELLKERSDDITHRRNAGIEEVWRRARTQYAHGDAEKATSGFEKGRDLDGPISKGYTEPENLVVATYPNTGHHESYWARRVADALNWWLKAPGRS